MLLGKILVRRSINKRGVYVSYALIFIFYFAEYFVVK